MTNQEAKKLIATQTELADILHAQNVEKYAAKIDAIYKESIESAYKIAKGATGGTIGAPFQWTTYSAANEKMNQELTKMSQGIQYAIKEGVEAEWEAALVKSNKLIAELYWDTGLVPDVLEKLKTKNLEALQAFQARKTNGMNLSDRVWNQTQQFKQEMELSIDVALGEGKTAAQFSRDVRKYLNEPDKLFHKVKNKKTGKLQLSKAAKAYHPGKGVYRSSYKNAMRLTRTEINMAYRTSDQERWKSLDFVVGYEVRLSNAHPAIDICDDLKGKYPKNFSFTGWHPHCKCHAIPILATPQEFEAQAEHLLNDIPMPEGWQSKETVRDVPVNFKDWVANNAQKIAAAKNKPYFIADNYVNGSVSQGLNPAIQVAAPAIPEVLLNTEEFFALSSAEQMAAKNKYLAQYTIKQAKAAGYQGDDLDALQALVDEPGTKSGKLYQGIKKLEQSAQEHQLSGLYVEEYEAKKAAEAAAAKIAEAEAAKEAAALAEAKAKAAAQAAADAKAAALKAQMEQEAKLIQEIQAKEAEKIITQQELEVNPLNQDALTKKHGAIQADIYLGKYYEWVQTAPTESLDVLAVKLQNKINSINASNSGEFAQDFKAMFKAKLDEVKIQIQEEANKYTEAGFAKKYGADQAKKIFSKYAELEKNLEGLTPQEQLAKVQNKINSINASNSGAATADHKALYQNLKAQIETDAKNWVDPLSAKGFSQKYGQGVADKIFTKYDELIQDINDLNINTQTGKDAAIKKLQNKINSINPSNSGTATAEHKALYQKKLDEVKGHTPKIKQTEAEIKAAQENLAQKTAANSKAQIKANEASNKAAVAKTDADNKILQEKANKAAYQAKQSHAHQQIKSTTGGKGLDVNALLKDHTPGEVDALLQAIETKKATWTGGAPGYATKFEDTPIQWQKKKLQFEIDWLDDPKNQKYSTWKAAQNIYKGMLDEVKAYEKLDDIFNANSVIQSDLDDLIKTIQPEWAKNKAMAAKVKEASAAIAKGDLYSDATTKKFTDLQDQLKKIINAQKAADKAVADANLQKAMANVKKNLDVSKKSLQSYTDTEKAAMFPRTTQLVERQAKQIEDFYNLEDDFSITKLYDAKDKARIKKYRDAYINAYKQTNGNIRSKLVKDAQDELVNELNNLRWKYAKDQKDWRDIGINPKSINKAVKNDPKDWVYLSEEDAKKAYLRYTSATPVNEMGYQSSIGGNFPGSTKRAQEADYISLCKRHIPGFQGDPTLMGRYFYASGFSNNYILNKGWGTGDFEKVLSLPRTKKLLDDYPAGLSYSMRKMPRFNGVTYRGVSNEEMMDDIFTAFQKGKPWTHSTVMSTSTKIQKADGFADRITFVIRGRGGVFGREFSEYPDEWEVLMRGGSKFNIDDIVFNETTYNWEVYITEILE